MLWVFNFFFSFIFMALLEEAAKYTAFRLLLLNKNQTFSWADVTAFMVIVGAAFQMVENMFYAFSYPASSPLRGLLLLHIAYGFIMGWFYGKRLYSGKKLYAVIGFVVTWLIHGTLIFCLTPKIVELNHNLVIIGNILTVVLFAILVLAIIFFITAKKKEQIQQKNLSGYRLKRPEFEKNIIIKNPPAPVNQQAGGFLCFLNSTTELYCIFRYDVI